MEDKKGQPFEPANYMLSNRKTKHWGRRGKGEPKPPNIVADSSFPD